MATALASSHRPGATWRRAGAVLASLVLALGALVLVQRLAGAFHPHAIGQALAALPRWRIAGAVGFTALSYLVLIGYDLMALRALGESVPLRTTARAAFTSYAISHNLGFALLTGGSTRLRLYRTAGLAPAAVARIVIVAGTAFWAGVGLVGALGLLLGRAPVRFGTLALSVGQGRMLGAALAAGLVGLALAPLLVPGRLAALRTVFPRAGVRWFGLLVAAGAFDFCVSAAALMILLPDVAFGRFPQLCVVYALAVLAGLVTHVPGGIGVFEATVLAGLGQGDGAAAAHLAAGLLAYRAIYYFLPLLVALATNALAEAGSLRRRAAPVLRVARSLLLEASPAAMGALAFAGGSVLLLSGAMPAVHGRMHALVALLPLPFIEASHLSASLVGMALLLVAPALVDRLESGMRAARLLFMLGAAFSLAKGLDFEEAIVMLTLAATLQLAAPAFYRRTAGAFGAGGTGWLIAAAAAVALSTVSGIHAYRHLPYGNQLWWEFALHGDAPRFLRASFATGVVVAGVAISRLLHRPVRTAGLARLPDEVFARATAHCPRSDANLALTGDKRFLVHPAGDAFVMFRPQGRTWVVMGDPVGPPERWADLCWQLRRTSDAGYARLCFYHVSAAMLPLIVDLGLRAIKYGEEAHIDLAAFTLDGPRMKSLRNSRARALREGLRVEFVPAARFGVWRPELTRVSDRWLAARGQDEKGFSLGSFTPAYIRHFDLAVVTAQDRPGRVLAFANLWASGDGREYSVDLMRHDPDAPPGTMDFLFLAIIEQARQRGCARFNLGLAPLSGVRGGKLAPAWARLANLAFAMDAGAYGFAGLRHYKAKFAPDWRPLFIATPTGLPGLRALVDVLALVGD